MRKQKGISTPFAILVVGVVAIIGFTIVFSYQWLWTPEEEEARLPEIETPKGAAGSYIKVISPNGGEVWEVGKTYDIKWEFLGIEEEVFITLLDYELHDSCRLQYEKGIPAAQEKYSYITGETGRCPAFVGNKMKIEVRSGSVKDESDDYFSIIE